jgi:hypothetical protein
VLTGGVRPQGGHGCSTRGPLAYHGDGCEVSLLHGSDASDENGVCATVIQPVR